MYLIKLQISPTLDAIKVTGKKMNESMLERSLADWCRCLAVQGSILAFFYGDMRKYRSK